MIKRIVCTTDKKAVDIWGKWSRGEYLDVMEVRHEAILVKGICPDCEVRECADLRSRSSHTANKDPVVPEYTQVNRQALWPAKFYISMGMPTRVIPSREVETELKSDRIKLTDQPFT